MNVLQKLQAETIRSELSLIGVEAETRRKILKLLNTLENEIVGQLTAIDPTHPTMTAYQQARLTKLLKEVKIITNTSYKKAAVTATQELEATAVAATKAFANSINFAVGAKIAKATIPQALLTKLVDTTLVETAPSGDWWARQPKQLVDKFYDQMRVGMAKGDTLDQLIKRVRGVPAANGKMAVSGIMDVSRRNAAALVRTATQSIANQARIEAMTANRDVVKGLQWLATLDNRTTEICRKLDGKVWKFVSRDSQEVVPVGHDMEYPGPTAHWGCRSVVLPWLKSWEEMTQEAGGDTEFAKQLDSIDPGTRSALNGQIPATMTYEEWLNTIDRPEAIQALGGEANFELWQAKKLEPSPELAATVAPSRPPRVEVHQEALASNVYDSYARETSDKLTRLFEDFLLSSIKYEVHVKEYTRASKDFNKWLSAGMDRKHYDATTWLARDQVLNEAFVKAPPMPVDVTVFSGVSGSLVDTLSLLPNGAEITLNRYLSASLSGGLAKTFTPESNRVMIQLNIHAGARNAMYIAPVSVFKWDELDVLVRRGARLRLLRTTQRDLLGEMYTVHIMEMVND